MPTCDRRRAPQWLSPKGLLKTIPKISSAILAIPLETRRARELPSRRNQDADSLLTSITRPNGAIAATHDRSFPSTANGARGRSATELVGESISSRRFDLRPLL